MSRSQKILNLLLNNEIINNRCPEVPNIFNHLEENTDHIGK